MGSPSKALSIQSLKLFKFKSLQTKQQNPAADPAEILKKKKKNLNELNLYKSYFSSKAIKSKLS